ncbi:MAG: histidinol dehydrogenase [Myxococcota bacterium]
MTLPYLTLLAPDDVGPRTFPTVDPTFRGQVESLIGKVRDGGDEALRDLAQTYDGLDSDRLWLGEEDLQSALHSLPATERDVLQRTADRIRRFAEAQKRGLLDVDEPVPGGRAGHRWTPVRRAGCYGPGGRYPLPSSILMTVVPARVAGVEQVVVAHPRPMRISLAAAAVAGADVLLAAGGAHAVAALAHGTESQPAVDVIAGPGNRWVTAAKQLVSGSVGIDMLAGPSELLVVADDEADPEVVAADLLAQAEHDIEARVGVLAHSRAFVSKVEAELQHQLQELSTREVASESLTENGFACVVPHIEAAATLSNRVAPEHLQLHVRHASDRAPLFEAYGGLFIGERSAEVLGDYGLGPNHTLPTGGTGRFRGGLSVTDFMVCRTWMEITHQEPQSLADVEALATMEGLDAHARSARRRGR